MSLVGQQVRQYRILSRLGRGGMGDVYEAFDQTLQRRVALKAIRTGRGLDPVARERFLREARILSQLDHPGICRIHDYITVGRDHYLVLELIEGTTLSAARADLEPTARLRVAREIAAVLAAAHAEDIVHRDLKPDNVMITPAGQVKILDFGLARSGGHEDLFTGPAPADPAGPADFREEDRTPGAAGADPEATLDVEGPGPADTLDLETPVAGEEESRGSAHTTLPGAVLGTPAFMSPEQARGEAVGPDSDIYSFGLILHWIFTGQPGYDQTQDVVRLLEDVKEARTLDLAGGGRDPHLVRLAQQMKSRSRAARPTAAETVKRLDWILDKPRRRNRRLIAVAAALAVVLFAAKYTLDVRTQRQVAERNRAEAESLIEFMVGDLSAKLAPVGRLDVLEDVGTRALAYYESREEAGLTDTDRFRLVRTLTQIGQVRLGEGNLAAAEEAFVRARESAILLADREPENTAWLAALGAVHFWLGNVRYSEDDLDGAEREFRVYHDISQRLRELDPDDPAWRLEVGYATTNLAAVSEARGDLRTALAYLDSSLVIKRELVEEAPDDAEKLYSLTNSLAWAGRTHVELGELDRALGRYLEAEALLDSLVARDPRDMNHQSLLATQLQLTGDVFELMGRDDEARGRYEADLEIARRLAQHDPANRTWALGLATSLRALGRYHLRADEPGPARVHLEEAAALVDKVLAGDPEDTEALEDRAWIRLRLAEVAAAEGRPAEGLKRLQEEVLAAGDLPRDFESEARVLEAELAARLGRDDLRRDALARADTLLDGTLADSVDIKVLFTGLRRDVLAGRREGARDLAVRLADLGYARADVVRFCARNGLPTAG